MTCAVVAALEKRMGKRVAGSADQANRLIQAVATVQHLWLSLPEVPPKIGGGQ